MHQVAIKSNFLNGLFTLLKLYLWTCPLTIHVLYQFILVINGYGLSHCLTFLEMFLSFCLFRFVHVLYTLFLLQHCLLEAWRISYCQGCPWNWCCFDTKWFKVQKVDQWMWSTHRRYIVFVITSSTFILPELQSDFFSQFIRLLESICF